MSTLLSVAGLAVFVFGAVILSAFVYLELLVAYRNAQHRSRVRRAVRSGWVEPTFSADWALLDNDAPTRGVTSVSYEPEQGVRITNWTKHAKEIQRKAELAWLAGIAEEEEAK